MVSLACHRTGPIVVALGERRKQAHLDRARSYPRKKPREILESRRARKITLAWAIHDFTHVHQGDLLFAASRLRFAAGTSRIAARRAIGPFSHCRGSCYRCRCTTCATAIVTTACISNAASGSTASWIARTGVIASAIVIATGINFAARRLGCISTFPFTGTATRRSSCPAEQTGDRFFSVDRLGVSRPSRCRKGRSQNTDSQQYTQCLHDSYLSSQCKNYLTMM